MKRIVGALLVITFLNGCALPLVGSITTSSITSIATGNYQPGIISSAIQAGVHEQTGKTPLQHILELHFPKKPANLS